MSKIFFENNSKTYLENWPTMLYNESISTILIRLDDREVASLIAYNNNTIDETCEVPTKENESTLLSIQNKISNCIDRFPNGAFIKLGSRSPKDSYEGYKEGFKCLDGEKAIKLFNDSERIRDDLELAKNYGYSPYIAIREWLDIPEWSEFRGFIRNRKLVGLSQYNYRSKKPYAEIMKNASSIEWAIQRKSEYIADLLHMPDVVVDLFYKSKYYGNETVSEVKVIEINPFDIWTDPCLFNWNKDKFEDFEFRYNK